MNAVSPLLGMPHPARFTADEFVRLGATGVFEKYSKSELIDGEIICMNAQWSPHARVKTELALALAIKLKELGSALRPQIEVSVRLSDNSLPEPDITLTDYRGDGPVPLDSVVLVVEVSDSTLEMDLGRKADLYAAAGVPEYWVIDLNDKRALLHELPSKDGYLGQADVLLGGPLHSAVIDGLLVETQGLVE